MLSELATSDKLVRILIRLGSLLAALFVLLGYYVKTKKFKKFRLFSSSESNQAPSSLVGAIRSEDTRLRSL